MKKKNVLKLVLAAVLSGILAGGLIGCASSDGYRIAVPSDTTNEARALLLLQDQGLITLTEGVGLSATANDIVENPYNITIVETEAASVPRTLEDVDMAVINGNYVLSGGIDPSSALVGEDPNSDAAIEYANIVAVRGEDIASEKTKVLVDALQSDEVKQFIQDEYKGIVVPVDLAPAYESNSAGAPSEDKVIKVGASPSPHAEILEFARSIIEEQGYTLEIVEFSDYVIPNVALADGELDANYFQHLPYLEDSNDKNGTDLIAAAKIHFEPLALYPGKTATIEALKG